MTLQWYGWGAVWGQPMQGWVFPSECEQKCAGSQKPKPIPLPPPPGFRAAKPIPLPDLSGDKVTPVPLPDASREEGR